MATLLVAASLSAGAPPVGAQTSRGADRAAIDALLRDYAEAVSTKDETRFEALLLDRNVTFSGVSNHLSNDATSAGMRNYESFRHGVFEGPPFKQRFRDIRVEQDGPLASVGLVFVNTSPGREGWGWKTLSLVKVAGRWKIASELYTYHG